MSTEAPKGGKKSGYKDKEKPTQIRFSNITAAKGSLSADELDCFVDKTQQLLHVDLSLCRIPSNVDQRSIDITLSLFHSA